MKRNVKYVLLKNVEGSLKYEKLVTIICDVQNDSDYNNTLSELTNITSLFVETMLLVNCYVKCVSTTICVSSEMR